MSKKIEKTLGHGENEVIDRLRTVFTRGQRQLRLTYTDETLSPTQLEVLAMIVRRGPLRLSEVATLQGLNPTMLSRIVAKLEVAHLVTRTTDATDGRVAHLAATEQGKALNEMIRRQRSAALAFALEQLSTSEQRTLSEALPVLESLVETLRVPQQ
jgi:DNA-binding MarR family transcriptional regulator